MLVTWKSSRLATKVDRGDQVLIMRLVNSRIENIYNGIFPTKIVVTIVFVLAIVIKLFAILCADKLIALLRNISHI